MKKEEYSLQPPNGPALWAQAWLPDDEPRAAIAFVHGIGEHSGRYGHIGEAAAARGYALLAFDLPGHGKSPGTRGHAAFDGLAELAALHLEETRRRHAGKPLFLYGASLGGAIVLRMVLTRRPPVSGVVVSAPGLGVPVPVPAMKITLGRIMDRLWPSFTMGNGLDLKGLSRDPAVLEKVQADPMYHTRISARLGWGLIQSWDWFARQKGEFPAPLLIMQGTRDIVVDPAATKAFASRMTGDVTLKLWDGLYHELHNEPEKQTVLAFALDWMDKHARVPLGR